ncbi:outer membrane protein assembly factor BamE [Vandammella animalimorsus]|uniref:Outer membrane protein assembly factor BamE n=1 Tax=Vandammella animalimorsus TaxID=2029117 RepID=A0A2A2AYL5_9BURK|nr:outer membrane protein assembly factor BamE [Vandammella animalimorsus]PAT42831.1 outer membrane assembly protein BamE [Vandammella animalimorsus]
MYQSPSLALPLRGLLLGVLMAVALGGCGSINRTSHRMVEAITPYRIEVVQGNFVSREQVQALRPGMSREQVRDILGSPLLASVFHADRWDYVFSIKRRGLAFEEKKLTVFFSGFVLERVEGDEMPSENEFVAMLAQGNRKPRVPKLEAAPEQLERYAPKRPAAAEQADAAQSADDGAQGAGDAKPQPRPRGSYPALEQ